MRVLAFDLSGCFWQSWFATAGQHVDAAFERTVGRVVTMARKFERTVVCCDEGPSFRHELDAGYKANRPAKEEAAIAQLRRCIDKLAELGLQILSQEGLEADDLIASVVRASRERGYEVVIASSDKDLLQLVGEGVRAYSLAKDTILGPEEVFAAFGVRPDQIRDYLALCGDASDNIKGIPGVGPKHAARLLAEFGSAGEMVRRAEEVTPPGIQKALIANLGVLELAFRLVTLKDDTAVPFDAAGGVRPAPSTSRPAEAPAAPGTSSAGDASTVALGHAPGRGAEEPGTSSEVASPSPCTSRPAEASEGPGTFSEETTMENRSAEIDKLVAALAKAQGQFGHAIKDSKNDHFKSRYADLASVYDACRKTLSENGFAIAQTIRLAEATPRHRLTTTLYHVSGQWISSEVGVLARDDTPQTFGSALTYARRYSLAALVGVAQDDDDDAEIAHGRGPRAA